MEIHIRESVLKSLESGVCSSTDSQNGFLTGLWRDKSVHITGFRVSSDPSHSQFEQEFDKASNFLAASVQVVGLFFKIAQANVAAIIRDICKAVLPSDSILRECFGCDQILVFAVSESSDQSACYWYDFEKQDLCDAKMKASDADDAIDSLIMYRIQGSLTLGFEEVDNPDDRLRQIQSEIQNLKNLVRSPAAVFRAAGSNKLIYSRQSADYPDQDGYADWPAKRLLEHSADAEGKDQRRSQTAENKTLPLVDVSLALQLTGKVAADNCLSCVPVIHHDHKNFRYVTLRLPLDVLAVSDIGLSLHRLPAIFAEGIGRNLDSMAECLCKFSTDGKYSTPMPHHFRLPGFGQTVTAAYPNGIPDTKLRSFRESLHRQFNIPLTRPVFRRTNALSFAKNPTFDGRLLDVHLSLLPSGVIDGRCCLVRGHYAYYHYMQDGLDDNGWGCAYRSLQTLSSWFRLQGYTEKAVPSHTEIQQCLVSVGDKEAPFVGSKKWIGSVEVGYVLDQLFGVTCKTLHVSSGAEMATKARELVNHFETQETPVMIGGGVLAHTILGIDWNEITGDVKFLILDPHYTGGENLRVIQDKGWCDWKSPDFWVKNAYYNMCLPQRPTEF